MIKIMDDENNNEDLRIPYVSDELINYLNTSFDIHYCTNLLSEVRNASEAIGFVKGVREVIDHLEVLNQESKESR